MHHRHLLDGRFVSAPEPRLSPYALAGVAILHVGGVSSSLLRGSKATRQLASPKYNSAKGLNKSFGSFISFACLIMNACMEVLKLKQVILVTGTPCVGKTSVARLLVSRLDAFYVNLTELALRENLVLGKDKERNSIIVDETRMQRKIDEIVEKCDESNVIVDGHYAVRVVPKKLVTHVFVLRRDPVELRKFMGRCGFSGRKLWENLASEILDVCLFDALDAFGEGKVCELDVTGKSVEDAANEVMDVLSGCKECRVGIVDWLGKLESEGLLEEYLKI